MRERNNTLNPDKVYSSEYSTEGKRNPHDCFFDREQALSQLLNADLVSIDWFEEDKENNIYVEVNLNDLFVWGCSDGEILKSLSDLQSLYDICATCNNMNNGTIIWAAFKRREKPQKGFVDILKEDGDWSKEMEMLPENHYEDFLKNENK